MLQSGILKLHHIGCVVVSVSDAAKRLAQTLNGTWNGHILEDERQGVRIAFIELDVPGRPAFAGIPMLELLEPTGPASPVASFLKHGGGMHHLCYEVCCLETCLEYTRSNGGLILLKPIAAAAFDGRRIAWVYTRDRLLLEYLESEKNTQC